MDPNLHTVEIDVPPEEKRFKKSCTQRQATIAWAYYKIFPEVIRYIFKLHISEGTVFKGEKRHNLEPASVITKETVKQSQLIQHSRQPV